MRGTVIRKNGMLTMDQPLILSKEEFFHRLLVLQPCYALTAGITNNGLTKLMKQAIHEIDFGEDLLPLEIKKEDRKSVV